MKQALRFAQKTNRPGRPRAAESRPSAASTEPLLDLQRQVGNRALQGMLQRQATAAAAAATGPTSDALLNEWLALHPGDHLSSDLSWILSQWPAGGSLNDLEATFRANVQALLTFVAATTGAAFTIFSYARSPEKQHIMHVAQYIRKGWVGYSKYKFSKWPDLVAAGGRSAVAALAQADRAAKLASIANPEALSVVWDTGTSTTAHTAAAAIAGSTGYGIGADNPVANGGSAYAWPTGQTTKSLHGAGNAVDAAPVHFPNEVVIRTDQAAAWPDLAAVQAAFGASQVTELPATDAAAGAPAQPPGYKIRGLANVTQRDAFLELFFNVRSAARAGFTDPNHFQAP